jgi:hypothetical protein
LARSSLVAGAVSDLTKSKTELMAENALLRKQLIILNLYWLLLLSMV